MKAKFGDFILVSLLTFLVGTHSAFAMQGMSDVDKQVCVQELEAVMQSGKYSKMLDEWVEGEMVVHHGLQYSDGTPLQFRRKRDAFFGNGKYNVRINFIKDGDFPKKSTGHSYKEDKTLDFAEHWRREISAHYLGHDYEGYDPVINAVTSIVSIDVLVSSSAELANIIKDGRVKSVRHVGTSNDVEIIVN